MRKGVIIGVGVGLAGLGLLVASGATESVTKRGDERVTGIPETGRMKVVALKPGHTTQNFRIGPGVYLLDGSPLMPTDPIERYNELGKIINDVWALRRTTLPSDADQVNTDEYSKELYWVPSWLANWHGPLANKTELISGGNGVPVDEFGRSKSGHYGEADNSLWGQTFGGLLKNPLFQAVVVGALIASGPQGVAVYGAYTMWQARGTDLTASNALLLAGRSYAVAQCGPACGVAFDFGVGVASGKSVDTAAEDALYREMNPQQQAAYKQGKETVHKMGL